MRSEIPQAYCAKCGAPCSGKLTIEARKGFYYSFCTPCFNKVGLKKLKEVRKLIKNGR